VKALLLMDEELRFTSDSGESLPLSKAYTDMSAFLKTDDTIYNAVVLFLLELPSPFSYLLRLVLRWLKS